MSTPQRLDVPALNASMARQRRWAAAHPEARTGNPGSTLVERAATMAAVNAADAAARLAAVPPAGPATRVDPWAGIVPRRFRDAALDGLRETPNRADLLEWARTEGTPPNLVMCGPTGTGKTWAATAVARHRHDEHRASVAWWPVVELLDALRPGGDPDAYRRAATVDVLVLDEVGAHKATDWADERLYALVNRRWLDERPIVATSNLDAATTLREVIGSRMWSRLVGDESVALAFAGDDLRIY